jgi:hypothetical protein
VSSDDDQIRIEIARQLGNLDIRATQANVKIDSVDGSANFLGQQRKPRSRVVGKIGKSQYALASGRAVR